MLATIFVANISMADNKQKKADEDTATWNYEIETLAKNNMASYILKVWSFSKDPNIAEEQGKKNAIHAVVFNGVPSSANGRTPGIKALVSDPTLEKSKAKFFETFFGNGGDYLQFVTISNNGFADIIKLPKMKKNGQYSQSNFKYKVGLTVTVNVSALRKYLEQKKIISALNSGF